MQSLRRAKRESAASSKEVCFANHFAAARRREADACSERRSLAGSRTAEMLVLLGAPPPRSGEVESHVWESPSSSRQGLGEVAGRGSKRHG